MFSLFDEMAKKLEFYLKTVILSMTQVSLSQYDFSMSDTLTAYAYIFYNFIIDTC